MTSFKLKKRKKNLYSRENNWGESSQRIFASQIFDKNINIQIYKEIKKTKKQNQRVKQTHNLI